MNDSGTWLKKRAVKITQERIESDAFKSRHRQNAKAFTRCRSLPFALVLVLVMRNSVKSLQNVVNEAMTWLGQAPVTASAYSQARYIPNQLEDTVLRV